MSIRKGSSILAGNGGSGGGSAMNVDNITTELNQSQEIQAVGVIEKNKSLPKYDWIGTYEEWTTARRNDEIDDSWICYITDDEVGTKKSSKQRTLGEIIFSLIELDDPSLHFLDGTLIDGTGLYNGFYTYMKNLYENGYQSSFTTESNWQSTVTQYGACGKFVLDTTNQTIRLPQLVGFVEGTLNEDAVGELVEAGLPNITGHSGTNRVGDTAANGNVGTEYNSGGNTGALKHSLSFSGNQNLAVTSRENGYLLSGLDFDASQSNSIYGNSNTVQPQSIKGFYYIVLATSVNMDIEIDATDLLNTKADKDLINTGYLTNCITEIPQNIKLELDNGVLTLKAGSKVYIPDGFEQDGTTKKFNEVIISSDLDYPLSHVTTDKRFVSVKTLNVTELTGWSETSTYSGPSAPSTGGIWYDTTNNIIKYSNDSGSSWATNNYSLPICIGKYTNGTGFDSIDQVFNGFGYFGKIVFALPGVKGLIPNGRNPDGTLNNNEFILNNVITTGNIGNNMRVLLSTNGRTGISFGLESNCFITSETINFKVSSYYYNTATNIAKKSISTSTDWYSCGNETIIGYCNTGTDRITSFYPKTTFKALDYNDKGTIAGWGMPSNVYEDLTLGTSGTTYTAPANGWYALDKQSSAANQYIKFVSPSITKVLYSVSNGQEQTLDIEVKKGDTITLYYNLGGATNYFRFVYAEGEV